MKSYLGFSVEDLKNKGGIDTAKEISGQPELWAKTYDLVREKQNGINDFLKKVLAVKHIEVVLTGAGTSAFIGLALEGSMQKNLNVRTRAVATTDLVTHPNDYLKSDVPTLLISFARSGNSPESFAAVELANKMVNTLYHFVITCNEDGRLAKQIGGEHSYTLVLPKESNDKGLAMTGSFTSMVLAGYLISKFDFISLLQSEVEQVVDYGKRVLHEYTSKLYEISKLPFKRAIFLGSGPLFGCAKESHLKLQEMTDGKIICKNDSYLGFRHGPKAVIDKDTLILFLFSNNDYVKQYELDLVEDINNGERGIYRIGAGEYVNKGLDLDFSIEFSRGSDTIEECLLSVVGVLPAQILGFYKSLNMGLDPDCPSESGTITRVVEGVKIYSYNNEKDIESLSI